MRNYDITKINPRKNSWLIQKIEPEKVKNGIILTNKQTKHEKGIIVKCATPKAQKTELDLGETVWFSSQAGSEITWDKKSYLIIDEELLLGKGEDFKPLSNRVIIEPIEQDEKTESGIYVQKEELKYKQGTVISVGDYCLTLKEGDTVLFEEGDGITIKDKDYVLMREPEILGVFN